MSGAWTPGPWRWQGEDYRGDWGWQMLVGPTGEGLIVGQGKDGGISPHLKAYVPVDPELCVTGMDAVGKDRAECVHVFSEANARLIAAAPDLAEACRIMIPSGVCLTNRNVPDSAIVSLDCTIGELRQVAAALAKATTIRGATHDA